MWFEFLAVLEHVKAKPEGKRRGHECKKEQREKRVGGLGGGADGGNMVLIFKKDGILSETFCLSNDKFLLKDKQKMRPPS